MCVRALFGDLRGAPECHRIPSGRGTPATTWERPSIWPNRVGKWRLMQPALWCNTHYRFRHPGFGSPYLSYVNSALLLASRAEPHSYLVNSLRISVARTPMDIIVSKMPSNCSLLASSSADIGYGGRVAEALLTALACSNSAARSFISLRCSSNLGRSSTSFLVLVTSASVGVRSCFTSLSAI